MYKGPEACMSVSHSGKNHLVAAWRVLVNKYRKMRVKQANEDSVFTRLRSGKSFFR